LPETNLAMNLRDNPELLDRLAAAHALGTLRGGARRRFEALARESATVRAAALLWQERMAAMTELQPQASPSPNVWKRIDLALAAQRAREQGVAQPASSGLADSIRRHLAWWRGAALAGGLASVVAVFTAWQLNEQNERLDLSLAQASQSARQTALQLTQLQAAPRIDYVAVLADDKATASMLITYDPRKNTLTVKRVGAYQVATDKSLQLWALPAAPGSKPQSLGVLGDGQVLQLPAAEAAVKEIPTLAISLEPKGGVPGEGGPTGPVLFTGALIRTVI
jgi:anti-sigma-K factor RskA